MYYPIGEMRATVFTGPIVYEANNLKRISELLPIEDGFEPNLVPPIQMVPGLRINLPAEQAAIPTEWELVSTKKMIRIHFGPQKIDVIKSNFTKDEIVGCEVTFCTWACNLFCKIIERFLLTPTRLAFAPTYVPEWTKDFTKRSFNTNIYRKQSFKDSEAANILFKQVFRVKEQLCDKIILFNYVAEASEGQAIIENVKNKILNIRQMLNLSLDINTYQGNDVEFTIDELNEFFINAPKYAKDFLEYYLE